MGGPTPTSSDSLGQIPASRPRFPLGPVVYGVAACITGFALLLTIAISFSKNGRIETVHWVLGALTAAFATRGFFVARSMHRASHGGPDRRGPSGS
jgi:hypothetical protein